jgi:hypothetical protein
MVSVIPQPGGGHTQQTSGTVTPGDKTSIGTTSFKYKKSGGGPKAPGLKPISGNASVVMILSLILFLFAFWKQIGSPLWETIFTGKPNKIQGQQLQIMLGGVVFIVVLTALASFAETAGVATVTIVGLWGVYLVMNGKQFVAVLNWLQGVATKPAAKSATSTTPPPANNGASAGGSTTNQ